jgi:PII-like signaling protein
MNKENSDMHSTSEAKLLRIFISETDKHHGRPLYEEIVMKAREQGLAGATVLRGLLGYGIHSKIHSAKILRLSEDMPLVIEIVDSSERIEKFMAELDGIIEEGLVTTETVQAKIYRRDEPRSKTH